jgi:hypothetical protein
MMDHECISDVRVSRTAFHNTLPNVIGPWFPRREDGRRQSLYFASMLALLRPWRQLSLIKTVDNTWEAEFKAFVASTCQRNRDVIAGAQYYYDSRTLAEEKQEKEDAVVDNRQDHITDLEDTVGVHEEESYNSEVCFI